VRASRVERAVRGLLALLVAGCAVSLWPAAPAGAVAAAAATVILGYPTVTGRCLAGIAGSVAVDASDADMTERERRSHDRR
jgi:hypothetical protein